MIITGYYIQINFFLKLSLVFVRLLEQVCLAQPAVNT